MSVERILLLPLDGQIMLRSNLWVKKGLANGSIGILKDVLYAPEANIEKELPIVLLCYFKSYTGPKLLNDLVPIPPITIYWNENGINCNRTQFPVQLINAINIHKTQGLTINDPGIINIGDKEFSPGLTYVALSRFTSLENILFLNLYTYNRLKDINNLQQIKERKNFLEFIKNSNYNTYLILNN